MARAARALLQESMGDPAAWITRMTGGLTAEQWTTQMATAGQPQMGPATAALEAGHGLDKNMFGPGLFEAAIGSLPAASPLRIASEQSNLGAVLNTMHPSTKEAIEELGRLVRPGETVHGFTNEALGVMVQTFAEVRSERAQAATIPVAAPAPPPRTESMHDPNWL